MSAERLKRRLDRIQAPRPTFRQYDRAAKRNDARATLIQLDGKAGEALDFFGTKQQARDRKLDVDEAKTLLQGDTPQRWRQDQKTIEAFERGWIGYTGKRAWPYSEFKACDSIRAVRAAFERKARRFKLRWERRLAATLSS